MRWLLSEDFGWSQEDTLLIADIRHCLTPTNNQAYMGQSLLARAQRLYEQQYDLKPMHFLHGPVLLSFLQYRFSRMELSRSSRSSTQYDLIK